MATLRNANGEIVAKEEIVINQPAEYAVKSLDEVNFVAGIKEQVKAQETDLLALNISNSFSIEPSKVYTDENLDLIVNKIASAMNAAANQKFKGSTFLEPCELEDVKKILDTEKCDLATKNKFEEEITNFQKQIKTNYVQQINEYNEKKILCDMQIERLESLKKHLVMERLSQMSWPYDERTREYDRKIATLKIQSERCSQRVQEIRTLRPAAKEKDILIFQVQLKEKFTT